MRRLQGDLNAVFRYIKESYKKDRDAEVCSDRIRGSGFKLREGIFSLDVRKNFTISLVAHLKTFSREVMETPLKIFSHIRRGFEDPDLVEDAFVHDLRVGLADLGRFLPTQTIL